jgi:hypothetical protein
MLLTLQLFRIGRVTFGINGISLASKMKAFSILAGAVALLSQTILANSIAEAQALYPACAVCRC